MNSQPSILPGVPRVARYLSFRLREDVAPEVSRRSVEALEIDDTIVVGLGEPMVSHWNGVIEGLRTFPSLSGPGVQVPATQQALWCWLPGNDQGLIVNRSIAIIDALSDGFQIDQIVDGFKYGDADLGLDLTGYEDGTENPVGDEAIDAAFVATGGDGIAGSSFVAVQQWVHDLRHFASLPQADQDNIIGRRKSDNEELDDAPSSAHTKRTAQESFDPEAFVLRRSMPFAGPEDGIPDALFRFSHPVSGGYYWCPPVRDGRLDLRAV
jgi:putative iron-dependent peroxidase